MRSIPTRALRVLFCAAVAASFGVVGAVTPASAAPTATCATGQPINGGPFTTVDYDNVHCVVTRANIGLLSATRPTASTALTASTSKIGTLSAYGGNLTVRSSAVGTLDLGDVGSAFVDHSYISQEIEASPFDLTVVNSSVAGPTYVTATGAVTFGHHHFHGPLAMSGQDWAELGEGDQGDGYWADIFIHDSTIAGDVKISAEHSVSLCSVHVTGSLTLAASADVHVGGRGDGPFACSAQAPVRVDGNVNLDSNDPDVANSYIELVDAQITGSLTCSGRVFLTNVTVAGRIINC